MKPTRLSVLVFLLLVLLCAALRVQSFVHGWYNFAPVGALALFGGAVVKSWVGRLALAVLPLLLSDIYLQIFTGTPGFYGLSQAFVYGGMLAVAVLGSAMRKIEPARVLGFAVSGSVLFFLVSNFGYWAEGHNGYTAGGLLKSYVDAVPFYRGTLVGDVLFAALLFGGWALATRSNPVRVPEGTAAR